MKKDAAPRAIGEVIVHLCLEAKVQKIHLGELKDVIAIQLLQGLDGDDWVKTRHCQLKHPPEIIVAIVGFIFVRQQGSH